MRWFSFYTGGSAPGILQSTHRGRCQAKASTTKPRLTHHNKPRHQARHVQGWPHAAQTSRHVRGYGNEICGGGNAARVGGLDEDACKAKPSTSRLRASHKSPCDHATPRAVRCCTQRLAGSSQRGAVLRNHTTDDAGRGNHTTRRVPACRNYYMHSRSNTTAIPQEQGRTTALVDVLATTFCHTNPHTTICLKRTHTQLSAANSLGYKAPPSQLDPPCNSSRIKDCWKERTE